MNLKNSTLELKSDTTSENQATSYEAPAIESILTSESLEREVHYAGQLPVSQQKT
ncbi:hypothetical protein IAD21_02284 [Abditibacteriota bacterium]|nr:hypothetical protein IAD21_02284 [Abditibacteriota bacterium]